MSSNSTETLRYKRVTADFRRYYAMPSVQSSLTVVLSIFIVAFFIFAAIRPTFRTVAELKKSITESQDVLKKLKTKSAALEEIGVTWEKISPLSSYVNNSIPVEGPRYKELSRSIEVIAYDTGVSIKGEQVGGAVTYSSVVDPYSGNARKVINMPYSISVTGSFIQLNNFLDQITTLDRIITIDNITFAKDTKAADGSSQASLSIVGNTHYVANEAIINKLIVGSK